MNQNHVVMSTGLLTLNCGALVAWSLASRMCCPCCTTLTPKALHLFTFSRKENTAESAAAPALRQRCTSTAVALHHRAVGWLLSCSRGRPVRGGRSMRRFFLGSNNEGGEHAPKTRVGIAALIFHPHRKAALR